MRDGGDMPATVYLALPREDELLSPYKLYEGRSRPIKKAENFSVSIATVVVDEHLDGIFGKDNDLLILTRSALGSRPVVERVHFYGEEIEKGQPISNLLANLAFVAEDYDPLERLWCELVVLEIDRHRESERKAAVDAFRNLAATTGAIFPAMVPYAFGVAAAAGVVEKLVSRLARDKYVVSVPVALHGAESMRGEMPLQEGTYVAFSGPVDASGWRLSDSGQLEGRGIEGHSYVVFNIAPKAFVGHTEITSQKIATLLTQLRDGNPASARSAIEFLRETLDSYSNFDKLHRYLELKRMEPAKRTDAEKAVMESIEQIEALQPFLPNERTSG